MEVETIAPIASSPLDYARGRGKIRNKPIVFHIEIQTGDVQSYSIKRLKTRRNRKDAVFLDSLHTIGLHVQ